MLKNSIQKLCYGMNDSRLFAGHDDFKVFLYTGRAIIRWNVFLSDAYVCWALKQEMDFIFRFCLGERERERERGANKKRKTGERRRDDDREWGRGWVEGGGETR